MLNVDLGFDEIAIVQPGRATFAAFKRGTILAGDGGAFYESAALELNKPL